MARGGRRSGKPGSAYAQRSDLAGSPQAVKTAPGQAYGAAQMQREMQQVMPVAGTAVPPPAAPNSSAVMSAAPGPTPGMGFADPTSRPDEPVMAGAPVGPGGGPEMLGEGDDVVMQLRAVYAAYPSEDLRAILQRLEQQ